MSSLDFAVSDIIVLFSFQGYNLSVNQYLTRYRHMLLENYMLRGKCCHCGLIAVKSIS
jgi:hypothetical protein